MSCISNGFYDDGCTHLANFNLLNAPGRLLFSVDGQDAYVSNAAGEKE